MKQWTMKSDRDSNGNPIDFEAFGEKFHVSKILARLLVNRHLNTVDRVNKYLFGQLKHLENPYLMKDIEKAAKLIKDAGQKKFPIRILGDYDVDGIMSCYILKEGLRICGLEADVRIPNRILHGYGMNPALVEEAYHDGIKLLLTCDNGISAGQAIEQAKMLGMQVIITDHHEVPYELLEDGTKEYNLPSADAIVNVKQIDCPYPYKGICGAYTAFRLIQVLYDACLGIKTEQGILKELLPLVGYAALATVCDVMELTGENRILVKEGLKLLPQTENLGMQTLIKECGLEGKTLNSYHFGFILGPCLNSAGRLYSAGDALSLFFSTEDTEQRIEQAKWLVSLNQQRKQMTEDGTKQAIAMIEKKQKEGEEIEDVLVIYLPSCHESIAGIVASKIKDRFFRPTIILTDPAKGSPLENTGIVKGSARSIRAYSMYDKLSECKNYLLKFGGHPLAAGLSLEKEKIDAFRKALNQNSGLTKKDFIEKISADMILPFSELSSSMVEELELLQPFGNGNDDPIFGLMDVQILSARYMGAKNQYLKLIVTDSSKRQLEAPIFHDVDVFIEGLCEKYGNDALENLLAHRQKDYRINLLYCPEINEFNHQKTIQIRIRDIQF